MITKGQVAELVAQMRQDHAFDRDGGYGLVEAILRLRNRLEKSDQKTLRDYLLERVNREDPKLWGIALETLVQEGSSQSGDELKSMLHSSGNRNKQWIDQVIFGLLRMGYRTSPDIYLPYIQSKLELGEPVCVELAHLYKVAPDISVKLSAEFFAEQLSCQSSTTIIENCISVFVHNYPEEDSPLLKIVESTSLLNQKAGERLKQIITDYLSKPWVLEEWGQKKINRMQSVLSS